MPRFLKRGGMVGALYIGDMDMLSKKPWFKKSEMHEDLPFEKGTVVSASNKKFRR